MDRDELIEKAGIYHNLTLSNGGCYRPTNGTEPLITHFLADFALGQYEAGQRAERERMTAQMTVEGCTCSHCAAIVRLQQEQK